MSDPAPSPPRDPVAGPIPPAHILRFFDDDDGDPFTAEDWLGMVNSYYEVPYRVLVADLEKFAQRVRDGALREAAEVFLAKWKRHSAEFSAEAVMRDVLDALVGTAPRE